MLKARVGSLVMDNKSSNSVIITTTIDSFVIGSNKCVEKS